MEEPSISRFNSQSTNRTLIGSEDGPVSPLFASFATDTGSVSGPLVQTHDNKQWIDLDVLSPKFVKELRRQYVPSSKNEPSGPFGKGAAKVKAFARQTKQGIDIKIRRKLNADQEQVTDIQLVPNATVPEPEFRDEKAPLISELPGTLNEINELPDTSAVQELDAVQSPSRTSTGGSIGEPLPRYEPRHNPSGYTFATSIDSERTAVPLQSPTKSHQPSASQSSIIPTPTRGLSLLDHGYQDFGTATHLEIDPDTATSNSLLLSSESSTENNGNLPEQQLIQEANITESLQKILTALQEKPSALLHETDESTPLPSTKNTFKAFRIASKTTYETETEAEAPPAIVRKVSNRSRKPGVALPRRKRKSATSRSKSSDSFAMSVESDEEVTSEGHGLLRMQTIPKRLTASSGAEALWSSLIKSQANLLGAEHPLVYQAKSDLAHSRANGHTEGSTNLSSLEKSQTRVADMLGLAHPRVHAFTEELKSLQSLVGSRPANVADNEIHPKQLSASESSSGCTEGLEERPASATQNKTSTVTGPSTRSQRLDREETGSLIPRAQQIVNDQDPSTSQTNPGDTKPELPKITTSLPSITQDPSPAASGTSDRVAVDNHWNVWHSPHKTRNVYSTLPSLAFDGLAKAAMSALQWLQANYGPEQPLEPGKVRVRWTCTCGKELYDDFVEQKRGAARRLEAILNRPRTHAPGNGSSPVSPSSSHPSNSFASSSFGFPTSSQTSWSSFSQNGQGSLRGNGDGKQQQSISTLPIQSQYHPFYEPPWLLTCANEDRYTPKLAHLDMAPHKITSDKDLAKSLRDHYFNVNNRWSRGLRMRGLVSIEFIQLEVHQNRFADIRKCPDMPELPSIDYTFEPSDLLPPVGSTYLLHLFKHPEDYDSELITYLRIPKRNGRLPLGVGWGINLVEGFLADRVWILVSSFFALGSVIFAIVWKVKEHDLQAASGIAAWILSFSILVFGWLQSFLG